MSFFKLKEEHLIEIVNFMENHTELATGRLSVVNAKDKFRELWQILTNILNSLGFGVGPVEKWQKTWTDYKGNLKKKAAEIKRHQETTGGGPEIKKKLTELELRVLSLLGTAFYAGCGVTEQGFPLTSAASEASEVNINFEKSPDTTKPSTSQVSRKETKCDETSIDHDYLSTPPYKKKKPNTKTDMKESYEETIMVLKNIENTVDTRLKCLENTVNNRLQGLTETINDGFQNVNQTLKRFGIE